MKLVTLTSLLFGAIITASSSLAFAERQPRMNAALVHLQKAKMQLSKASWDKGGHRVAALKHIQIAINQVKKGIVFDNVVKEQ